AAVAERKQKQPGRSLARKYMLSGIARCGLCKTKIRGQINQRWQPGSKATKFTYQCSVVNGGCGKVGRVGEPVDRLIAELALEEQRARAAATTVPIDQRWSRNAELEQVNDDITQLVNAERSKQITVTTLLQLLPGKERQRDELKLERARFYKELKQSEAKGDAANLTLDEFFGLPIERQQEIVLHRLSAVIIHPAGKGRRRFDPSLIEPVWR
ncbi:recombinase family protein, partial [Streptomyces sp. NPDC052015]